MPELKVLFIQMAVVLISARVLAFGFRQIDNPRYRRDGRRDPLLTVVIGQNFACDAVQPVPRGGAWLRFTPSARSDWCLFMFLIGLEVRPESLRGSAKSVVFASQASIAAPLVLGGALAWALHPRLGEGAPRPPFVLFLGAAMGVTAFPVLARILADRGLTKTRMGAIAISCAAVDDVTAWCRWLS
jgi:hypothetical protein